MNSSSASETEIRPFRVDMIERANSADWAVSTAADDSTRGSITLAFGRADLVIAANPYTTPPTIAVTLTSADPNL
jgi:hypothetical protein